jgi:glyoxylase-like metal-dependent hydrolase (beta-lactamase superfamily II)
MPNWQYTKGLHDIGNGCHAYLQPDGSWGWSNAGLISDRGETLLVDTLMDLRLTREMLAAMRRAVPAAARIGTLVNTHANPDHTFGNQLVEGASIVASAACAAEMKETPPQMLATMERNWREMGEGAAFFHETMGSKFRFDDVTLTLPTRTFERELTLHVGAKEIRLLNVGPAHTRGDTMVYLPGDRTVFTGDVLFVDGHPVMWAGPIGNWIKACDIILGWDVETVVPGHGPITDKAGVRRFRDYLVFIKAEARRRYDAGMNATDAAYDIALDAFDGWTDAERIVGNVAALYREFSGSTEHPNVGAVFAAMGRYRKTRGHAPGGGESN